MTLFLTVKEAAARVGKSPASIRRLIYPIIENDFDPDRLAIWPSIEEVSELRQKRANFPWKLSEELLVRLVPPGDKHERNPAASMSKISSAEGELIAMLRAELAIKNQQIQTQSELIAKQMEFFGDLAERLREGNLIIGSLQQRFGLTNGHGEMPESVDAQASPPAKTTKPERGSPSSSKPTKSRKGFFTLLFR